MLRIETWPRRLNSRFAFQPERAVFGFAVRAVLIVSFPLAVLRATGLVMPALFFAVGAIQMAIGDGIGPYRDRLLNLAGLCLLLPPLYFIGTQIGLVWWAAGLFMCALAFGSALLRSMGSLGIMMGLVSGATFLMGTVTAAPLLPALPHTGWVAAGCLWGLLLTLVSWRLRPYRALQCQVGATLDAAARLFVAITERREDLRKLQRAARSELEEAETALGAARGRAPGGNATLARLFTFCHVTSRLLMLAAELDETGARLRKEPVLGNALDAAVRALAEAAAAGAHAIVRHHAWTLEGAPSAAADRLAALTPVDPALMPFRDAAVEALRASLAHLGEAAAVSVVLAGPHGHGERWLPRLALAQRLREIGHGIRAQFTLRSALFRHALRLGATAGLAMAAEVYLRLPHGMWVPLTVLVVLQPDFGATHTRAFARGLGTLAGVAIAGIVIALGPGPAVWQAVIAVLVFTTVMALRQGYGLFVASLTPLIVLLLGLYAPAQRWDYVFERLGETGGGIVLSLAAALMLWPDWEQRKLPPTFATALEAVGAYLAAVFTAAANGVGISDAVLAGRREAELGVANAESAFQTMLAEPRRRQSERDRYQQLTVQLGRLLRHLGALAARLEAEFAPLPPLAPTGDAWAARLTAAAYALVPRGRRSAPPETAAPPPSDVPADVGMMTRAIDDAVDEIARLARPDWKPDRLVAASMPETDGTKYRSPAPRDT